MRFLSRFYALEAANGVLSLSQRGSNQDMISSAYEVQGSSLALKEDVSSLDAEACRLITQWAFEDQQAEALTLPLPTAPEALQVWAQQGAEIEAAGLTLRSEAFAAANRALGCKGASWLERELPRVEVACVALINSADEVLLAQRPEGKAQAGLWELPGGKLEPGESPELALCREMYEELGIGIWNSCLSPLTFVSHAYDRFHLSMTAFICYRWEGELQGREGQAFKWVKAKDLDPSLMPSANVPLVHAIQDLLA